MNDTILINRLPTRTWNRLGVNETALTWGQADDLGEEKITAAGQTEQLEITGSGERGEKTVDIHAPAGQTVTVFETLRAEKGCEETNHFVKPSAVELARIAEARNGRKKLDVFVKPNGQSRACASYAMARKRLLRTNG